MTRTVARAAIPALVLILALARLALGDPFARVPEAERRAPPPVSEAASEVLDDLTVGDALAGLAVARIDGPTNGEIVLELQEGEAGLRVWITRRGARPFAPPRQTERFDLLTGHPPPPLRSVADERAAAVLDALARRIEAGGAPVPAGM